MSEIVIDGKHPDDGRQFFCLNGAYILVLMFSNWVSEGVPTGAAEMVKMSVRATKILQWRHKEARLGVWASSATSLCLPLCVLGAHKSLPSPHRVRGKSLLPWFPSPLYTPLLLSAFSPRGDSSVCQMVWAIFGSLHSVPFRHPPWGPPISACLALSQPSHL